MGLGCWLSTSGTKPRAAMEALSSAWLRRHPGPGPARLGSGTEPKAASGAGRGSCSMKKKPTTARSPQPDGATERTHQALRGSLAAPGLPKLELPLASPFGSFAAAASWAIRSSYHSTLKATPGQLVFGSDMLLDAQLKAGWAGTKLRKQSLIGKGAAPGSRCRAQHDYKIGDKALYAKPRIIPKMEQPRTGPFEVKQVHANGTLAIEKGAAIGRVNIRNRSDRAPSFMSQQFICLIVTATFRLNQLRVERIKHQSILNLHRHLRHQQP